MPTSVLEGLAFRSMGWAAKGSVFKQWVYSRPLLGAVLLALVPVLVVKAESAMGTAGTFSWTDCLIAYALGVAFLFALIRFSKRTAISN